MVKFVVFTALDAVLGKQSANHVTTLSSRVFALSDSRDRTGILARDAPGVHGAGRLSPVPDGFSIGCVTMRNRLGPAALIFTMILATDAPRAHGQGYGSDTQNVSR